MPINLNDLGTQLLYSTVRIIADVGNGISNIGTGVIIDINRQKDRTVPILITNNHIIKNANKIFIELFQGNNDQVTQQRIGIEYEPSDFICDEEKDIAMVLLAPILTLAMQQGKNPFFKSIGEEIFLSEQNKEQFSAIEEIIFIGYPKGIIDNHSKLPVVRKGITATPVWNNFNNESKFLVDAEVFEGSSGSPVFIYNNGGYFHNGGLVVGTRIMFLGIISQTMKDNANNYLGLGPVINAISILTFIKSKIRIE